MSCCSAARKSGMPALFCWGRWDCGRVVNIDCGCPAKTIVAAKSGRTMRLNMLMFTSGLGWIFRPAVCGFDGWFELAFPEIVPRSDPDDQKDGRQSYEAGEEEERWPADLF